MEASPRHHRPGDDLVGEFAGSRLMAAQPDAVLCRLAARGRNGAYEVLYMRHRAALTAFVFHSLGRTATAEDAEDVVQDAFTRAFAGIREKRVDGSFKAWLFTIARNRSIDLLRSRREAVESLDAEDAAQPQAPAAEEPAERAARRAELAWLVTAVSELPERQREALLLREMGGLSHERIAQQLDTTVSATKKLISRGRDGIDRAALAGGLRPAGRKLGGELAIAAPLLPIAVSLASLGVGSGSAAGAAGGSAFGKAAAGVIAALLFGSGVVAVEQQRSAGGDGVADAAEGVHAVGALPADMYFSAADGAPGQDVAGAGPAIGDDDDRDERSDDDRSDRDDDSDDRRAHDRDDDDDEAGEVRGTDRDDDDDSDRAPVLTRDSRSSRPAKQQSADADDRDEPEGSDHEASEADD